MIFATHFQPATKEVNSRVIIGLLIVSALLTIVFHPRIFYGKGDGSSFLNFDDIFFAVQWTALALAVLALVLSGSRWLDAGRPASAIAAPLCALALVIFHIAFGIPHKANQYEWRKRELGITAFVRGMEKRRKENAVMKLSSPDAFAGSWRAVDGAVYTFSANSISWTDDSAGVVKGGEYSAEVCGAGFALEYKQGGKNLLESGFVWSEHAAVVADSTAAEAIIPVVMVECGSRGRPSFLRATPNEVWRYSADADIEYFKQNAFVLKKLP